MMKLGLVKVERQEKWAPSQPAPPLAWFQEWLLEFDDGVRLHVTTVEPEE